MDPKLVFWILALFSLFVDCSCKFSGVRFRGKHLDLYGTRGKTHFQKPERIRHPAIGRAMLLKPYARRMLNEEIRARSRAMTEVLCGDSCQHEDLEEGTTETVPGTDEVILEQSTVVMEGAVTAEGEEYYGEEEEYQFYGEKTTTKEPSSSVAPYKRFNNTLTLQRSKSSWFIPPFALHRFSVSEDALVPAARIGEKCDFFLYNESMGFYLDRLYSRPAGEWTEEEEELFLLEYEDRLLYYSSNNDLALTKICLNEFNVLACHPKKQICGCGNHGHLRMVQQPGTFTCTAQLGSYCEEPYITCTEDYDCVHRICSVHNYNTNSVPSIFQGKTFTVVITFIILISTYPIQ